MLRSARLSRSDGRRSYAGALSRRLVGIDRDLLARLAEALVLHHAADRGLEGEVAAQVHVGAAMNLGADLAHQNGAALNRLAAVNLHASRLTRRVAAVAGRALSFFVSHGVLLRKFVTP